MYGETQKFTKAYMLKIMPTDLGPTPRFSASARQGYSSASSDLLSAQAGRTFTSYVHFLLRCAARSPACIE